MKILDVFNRFLKFIEIIFGIIVILLLVLYAYILIKSKIYPDKVPDVFGYKPLIVLSGSMEPNIKKGDLVFVKETDTDLLNEGDVIAFRTPNNKIIIHRIDKITIENNQKKYLTKGDNNNSIDDGYLLDSDIEGIYINKVSNLGNVLIFIRKPVGLIICLLSIGVIGLAYILLKNYKALNLNYDNVKK